jgi:hypothetical protein
MSAALRSRQAATSWAEIADIAHLPPGFLGHGPATTARQHEGALLNGPLQATEFFQPGGHGVPQGNQVDDVARGIGLLLRCDGALQPVGQAVGLGQRDPQHLVDQSGQRWRGHAEKAGRHLRVVDDGWSDATGGFENIEILVRRVTDRDAGTAEDLGQRPRINGQGIDQGHPVGPAQLNQGQLGVKGLLGVELGVEGVARLRCHRVTDVLQVGLVLHQRWLWTTS